MVEIDNINNQYLIYKKTIEEKYYEIEQWQEEIDRLEENYQIEEANRIKARRKNKKEEEKQANDNIGIIKNKVEEIESKAMVNVDEIEDTLKKIDMLIKKLLENKLFRDAIFQNLEQQYISKIKILTQKSEKLEIERKKIDKVRKLLQGNPTLTKEIESIVMSSLELERLNFIIDNIEHNGILNRQEISNQKLLNKSKEEKEEQEKRNFVAQTNIRNSLSTLDSILIEEMIRWILEKSSKETKKINVSKRIERRIKEIENQETTIKQSLAVNREKLKVLQQKNKCNKRKEVKKKEGITGNQREEFLNRIGYEIVQEGIRCIKDEISEQSKEKEDKTK